MTSADHKAGEVHVAAMCPYGLLSPKGLQGAGRGKNQIPTKPARDSANVSTCTHGWYGQKVTMLGVCWSSLLGFLALFFKLQNGHVDASLTINSLG